MIIDNKHNKQDNDNYKETTMKKIPLLLSLLALSSTAALAATSPFVPNGSITINSMPHSENPIWTPPLASPSITSSGILSAFWSPNMCQANPNSPMPALSATCAKWVWSGSDNLGWQCTAKPAQTPTQATQQPPATATCTLIVQTFYCTTASGQTGGCTFVNGQPATLLANNIAVLNSNGQHVTCTAYN